MTATLVTLRDLIYAELNDEQWFISADPGPAVPSVATLRQVDQKINQTIAWMLRAWEQLGVYTHLTTDTISVLVGTREYALPDDFRAGLSLVRTDVDPPQPMYWAEAGDYRAREWRSLIGWPFDWAWDMIGDSRDLYWRGREIGFIRTPVETMTLTAYYAPTMPAFTEIGEDEPTEDLTADLELPAFEDFTDLIALRVRNALLPVIGKQVDAGMADELSAATGSFIAAAEEISVPILRELHGSME